MSLDDAFKTSSGLADEMELKILDQLFVTDAKYQSGEIPMLKLVGIMDGKQEISETWPVGRGWELGEGGATIVGKDKVNNQTAYGKFIDAFTECDGWQDVMKAQENPTPLRAATWAGLTLRLVRTDPETFKIDGEERKRNGILVPTNILAHEIVGVQQTIAVPEPVAIPEDEAEALTLLAKGAGSFEAFIEAAFDRASGQPWEDHVADDGPEGFYRQAV